MSDRRRSPPKPRRRLGRVEAALDNELRGESRRDVGRAERAALRAQAHAVDMAEASRDPSDITTANDCYLRLRTAAGLSAGGGVGRSDPFDALLAELARPGAGASDTAPA